MMESTILNPKVLKECLADLERVLPIVQKAMPQLRKLIQVAEGFGSFSIQYEAPAPPRPPEPESTATFEWVPPPKRGRPFSNKSKRSKSADPRPHIKKVREYIKSAPDKVTGEMVFDVFKEKGWNDGMPDTKLRSLLHGTLWRLKENGEITGSASEGYKGTDKLK